MNIYALNKVMVSIERINKMIRHPYLVPEVDNLPYVIESSLALLRKLDLVGHLQSVSASLIHTLDRGQVCGFIGGRKHDLLQVCQRLVEEAVVEVELSRHLPNLLENSCELFLLLLNLRHAPAEEKGYLQYKGIGEGVLHTQVCDSEARLCQLLEKHLVLFGV